MHSLKSRECKGKTGNGRALSWDGRDWNWNCEWIRKEITLEMQKLTLFTRERVKERSLRWGEHRFESGLMKQCWNRCRHPMLVRQHIPLFVFKDTTHSWAWQSHRVEKEGSWAFLSPIGGCWERQNLISGWIFEKAKSYCCMLGKVKSDWWMLRRVKSYWWMLENWKPYWWMLGNCKKKSDLIGGCWEVLNVTSEYRKRLNLIGGYWERLNLIDRYWAGLLIN